MKQYKYLYRQLLDEENVRKAYKNLRKGKTKRKEIIYIDEHLDTEVKGMIEMIRNTKPPGEFVEHPEKAFVPKKQEPRIIFEHGKYRKIFMPGIKEQWLHHIIVLVLAPIILATAHPYTCGSFPKRGAHYGKRQMERWIRNGKGIKYFAKMDIRHFYNNIRMKYLMRWLRKRILDERFLYIIRLCFKWIEKGIPLGYYISQWLANYLLEPLDYLITKVLGFDKYVRYMDDITFFGASKKALHYAIAEVRKLLGRYFRLKIKSNYQVSRFDFTKRNGKRIGKPIDFMGFIFRRDRTTIRKSIMLSASRLARKMRAAKAAGRGFFKKHAQAMLSYMGWFTCTDTYDCYLKYIKPEIEIRKLKRIISKLQRRQNHDKLDAGTMRQAA